jgi:hypothetical protein
MSVKLGIISELWAYPVVLENEEDHDRLAGIRQLAQQNKEFAAAVDSYCKEKRAGRTPKFDQHFAAVKASVEAAYDAGERAKDGHGTGTSSARKAWLRGDDERHTVDSYWGEGTYDSEFTTDAMIDEALGG